MEKEDQLRMGEEIGQGDVEKEDQLRVGEETDRAMWRRKIS